MMDNLIVVVGSLNVDFVTTMDRFPLPGETLVGTDFATFPGGKGANQAYGAARLGGNVRMIGRVGADPHGDWLTQHLTSAGVDTAQVGREPTASTGVALIAIDASGQNQIVVVPGANAALTVERFRESTALVRSARVVLLQQEIPMATVLEAARQAKEGGAIVILDPAPAQVLPDGLLGYVDYVTPNETELAALSGVSFNVPPSRATVIQAARALRKQGAARVVVKLGSAGALLIGEGEEQFWPAIPVAAVDTTAAGDAFNAAFAWALASGNGDRGAGRFATAAAACSVTRRGAQPSMPTRAEVESLLNR